MKLLSIDQKESFHRDGVVRLKNAFNTDWIEMLRAGIDRAVSNPSPRLSVRRVNQELPAYLEDYWVWSQFVEFENFLRESPAALYAADMLQASRINLVMDNWFVREAGCRARAPWHHDISYFDFDGRMCVFWIPLEVSRRSEGIEFVRGSHTWDRLFMRVYFEGHQVAENAGWINGSFYENPPDIDNHRNNYDIVSFDLEPGDCLCFDIRTLHGSPPDNVPTTCQRRFTARMAAENGRIRYRGNWAEAERIEFEKAGHRDGDQIDSDFFPCLWRST